MRLFVQSLTTGGEELRVALERGDPGIPWEPCARCHVEVFRTRPERGTWKLWDKLGAREVGSDVVLREHAHTGLLGRRAGNKRVEAAHPVLFDNREGDVA